jgi:hypothetical protein
MSILFLITEQQVKNKDNRWVKDAKEEKRVTGLIFPCVLYEGGKIISFLKEI